MKAPWLTVTGKGAQGACGTCGALFILAIVYDRPACPLCGAAGSDSERLDWEPCPGSGRELFLHEGLSTAPCPGCPAHVAVVMTAGKGVADAHLRRRRSSPIAFEPGTRIRDVWTGVVAQVVKHDPRTGTTRLRNTETGTVQTMNSHNNALYVAVREAE